MSENVSVVVPRHALCGEGPTWDSRDRTVVWVDIVAGQTFRTDLAGHTIVAEHGQMVGAAAPRESGGLILAAETGFLIIGPDGTIEERLDILSPGMRMNDAKVDPGGRYWAGNCAMDFASGRGGLWRLDEQRRPALVLSDLTLPNGIGWSPDGRWMYLVETQRRQLLRFGFDPEAGELRDTGEVIADWFTDLPDGLCVDVEGRIWLAEHGGGVVHTISPDGERVRSHTIPTPQTTSCAFVGPDLDRLWVTSAAAGLATDESANAGFVFELHGHGTRGVPVSLCRV